MHCHAYLVLPAPDTAFNNELNTKSLPKFASITVFILWAFPHFVTLRTIDYWYSMLMAVLTVWVAPYSIRGDLLISHSIGVWIIALCFSCFNLNIKMNLLWLSILNLVACINVLTGYRHPAAQAIPSGRRPVDEAVALTVGTVMWAFALNGIYQMLSQVVRLEMEAGTSRKELAAAKSVLRGVCDVVVELDDSFHIQEGAPRCPTCSS